MCLRRFFHWTFVVEILTTPLQSVLALALLSSVEQGMEQHNRDDVYHIHTTTDGTSLDRQVESVWKTNMLNGLLTT